MRSLKLLFFVATGILAVLSGAFSYQQTASNTEQRAMLDKYCVTCHNQRLKTGGLTLDNLNLDRVADDAETWEKVLRKLHGGMMPPQGLPRPAESAVNQFTTWLETSIDRAAASRPEPGRSTIHRLNRTEYGNAIHDLLDLDIDAASLLPADDEANGFDNIADVLRFSPSLLEQYLSASDKIASLAVGDPSINPISLVFHAPPDLDQERHIEGLPLGTRGGIQVPYNFPLDGEYDFRVFLLQNIVGYVPGLEYAHQLEISIDGQRVFLAQVGGEEDNKMSDANLGVAKDTLDARLRTRIPVKAGPRNVVVTFLRRNSAPSDEPLQPFTRDHDLQNMNGVPRIDRMQITGPFNATGPGDTPSRRRVFSCRPSNAAANTGAELACARTILTNLARRAYRRPVTGADLETLLSFYQSARNTSNKNKSFDAGIQNSLRLILTNPKFLFRMETDPAGAAPGSMHTVTDLELASRLSFFLWSTGPDDQLITVASQGKLRDSAVLEQQVKRMLADDRSKALVKNFAGQWLLLRNLPSVLPDPNEFPNFDDNLRQAFRRETELFFESVLREDRSALDLLTADYTFVNERLAKHYGIPGIYGSQFRRVKLINEERRGLLGQGSILTVTSEANRTSPVKRGKFILEAILGTPPPPPPPNVPALKENEGPQAQSVRARLEEHRRSPACSGCHAVMDPLGFSLENFDGIGEWRTKEPGGAVDPSGQLADGTKVDGPVALRQAILKHPEQFARTLTEKLMTYGLGRGVEYYDMPTVRGIARDAARTDYKFSSIVLGIVKSTPFQIRRVQDAPVTARAQ